MTLKPVYHPKADTQWDRPMFSVTFKQAQAYVDQGLASWINRGKSLRLTSYGLPRVAPSLSMGASVIEAFIDGGDHNEWALECVAAWA